MFIIIADTYMESYGSENYMFGVHETEEDCIAYMKAYNDTVDDFLKEYEDLGKEPEPIWENEEDDSEPINIDELKAYNEKKSALTKKYEKAIVIDSGFYYGWQDGLFKFNLDKAKSYIKIVENKPMYIGGYCE